MNKTISRYLSKNILFPRLIDDLPNSELGIVIVIPCFDEPDIGASIQSIAHCHSPQCTVEVIVSINAGISNPIDIKKKNLESLKEIITLKSKIPSWLKIYPIIHNDLPDKKSGVGLGRKIGMDEAVRRFVRLGKENGILACFDADSRCDENYLCEIESHFNDPDVGSTSINYEHPIAGSEFPQEIYDSIIQYELHLRHFIRMQKMIKLPYAYHTVGSSMACKVSAYCAVGGMNQRKAGEDFYFVHKLVKFGKHSELSSTRIIPSPRISDRVPFGTGRAVGIMQASGKTVYKTYHPQSFIDLKELVYGLPKVYKNQKFDTKLPIDLKRFLASINAKEELNRILKNTSDYRSFHKMFWHWFDAFVLMKYLHFVRESSYCDISVLESVNMIESKNFATAREALIYYREKDIFS